MAASSPGAISNRLLPQVKGALTGSQICQACEHLCRRTRQDAMECWVLSACVSTVQHPLGQPMLPGQA